MMNIEQWISVFILPAVIAVMLIRPFVVRRRVGRSSRRASRTIPGMAAELGASRQVKVESAGSGTRHAARMAERGCGQWSVLCDMSRNKSY